MASSSAKTARVGGLEPPQHHEEEPQGTVTIRRAGQPRKTGRHTELACSAKLMGAREGHRVVIFYGLREPYSPHKVPKAGI